MASLGEGGGGGGGRGGQRGEGGGGDRVEEEEESTVETIILQWQCTAYTAPFSGTYAHTRMVKHGMYGEACT